MGSHDARMQLPPSDYHLADSGPCFGCQSASPSHESEAHVQHMSRGTHYCFGNRRLRPLVHDYINAKSRCCPFILGSLPHSTRLPVLLCSSIILRHRRPGLNCPACPSFFDTSKLSLLSAGTTCRLLRASGPVWYHLAIREADTSRTQQNYARRRGSRCRPRHSRPRD